MVVDSVRIHACAMTNGHMSSQNTTEGLPCYVVENSDMLAVHRIRDAGNKENKTDYLNNKVIREG